MKNLGGDNESENLGGYKGCENMSGNLRGYEKIQ